MKKQIKFAIKSWKGRRKINQDALACAYNAEGNFIAVVCDGVGSVNGSEHASKIVCDTFIDEFEKTNNLSMVTPWFKNTLNVALNNLTVFANKNNMHEIATTIAVLIIINKQFYTYNIGDTRIYAFRRNAKSQEVKQYSYDHNYKNFLMSKGTTEAKLQEAKPKWHALTNLIDASHHEIAKFDANSGKIDQRMQFLLCTDGLYAYVHDNDKINYVTTYWWPTPWKMTMLNLKAYRNGSNDNISGIIVSVK